MQINDVLIQEVIIFLFVLLIGAVFLHLATRILDFKNRSYGKAFLAILLGNILVFLLSYIPFRLLGILLGLLGTWFIIKVLYDVGWFKAFLAWIMSIVVAIVIAVILVLILGIFGIFAYGII